MGLDLCLGMICGERKAVTLWLWGSGGTGSLGQCDDGSWCEVRWEGGICAVERVGRVLLRVGNVSSVAWIR
jgi:hypothetical protein